MNTRQDLQAEAFKVDCKAGSVTNRQFSMYPTVPAMWPNRATRRAIKHNREDRLSGAWRGFLAGLTGAGKAAGFRAAVKAL